MVMRCIQSTIQHRISVLFYWYGCSRWPTKPHNVVTMCHKEIEGHLPPLSFLLPGLDKGSI